ncbi:MAG: DnaJ domain-containing protein [Thermonemataceae bacterium]|nr:DnaJ domain-containing protein [Thermonemataceae bacterium]
MNYYEILQIPPTADLKTIKKSYKKLAGLYHPDKNPDNLEQAEELFKQINEAYHILSDAKKREIYDSYYLNLASQNTSEYFGEQEILKKQRQEAFMDIIKQYHAAYNYKKDQMNHYQNIFNGWFLGIVGILGIIIAIINYLDHKERSEMYKNAIEYIKKDNTFKTDSIAYLLIERKPNNKNYYLLLIRTLISRGDYESASEKILFLKAKNESEAYYFYFLVCEMYLQHITPDEFIEKASYMENSKHIEDIDKAAFYLHRAVAKYNLLKSKKEICEDLYLSHSLGESKAKKLFYLCNSLTKPIR